MKIDVPKSPVRPAAGRRQRRFFELATLFQYAQVSDYPETLYSWQATAHPRKWALGATDYEWQTVIGEEFQVHQIASLDGTSDPPNYFSARARGTFSSPNHRGSYGIAELADTVNLWEVIWLEPAAQVIWGQEQSRTTRPDGTISIFLIPGLDHLWVMMPAGGIFVDQDPAQPFEIIDRRDPADGPHSYGLGGTRIACWNGVDWDLIGP